MYCKNCGRELKEGAKFCAGCGVLVGNGDAYCPDCGLKRNNDLPYCEDCGFAFVQEDSITLVKSNKKAKIAKRNVSDATKARTRKRIIAMIMAIIISFSAGFGSSALVFLNYAKSQVTNGKSAYEIWLDNGHTGTQADFLNWLKGEQGEQGDKGSKGDKGADGKSAYEIWLDNGFVGTEMDFLNWLSGGNTDNNDNGDNGGDSGSVTPPVDEEEEEDGPQGGATLLKTIEVVVDSGKKGGHKAKMEQLAQKWNTTKYGTAGIDFKVAITETTGAAADAQLSQASAPALMEIADQNYLQYLVDGKFYALGNNVASGAFPSNLLDRYKSGDDGNGYSPYAANAKLYGVPLQTAPTVLMYRESAFSNMGITIVSIAEDQVPDWMGGPYGYHCYAEGELTSQQIAVLGVSKTTWNELDMKTGNVTAVTGYRVFNNQVAMSFEESFALASVLTKEYNSQSTSTFGMNSEYSFPYIWSVGGDCLAYNELTGALEFSLNDTNLNYIVTKSFTVPGGDTYNAGSLLDYSDKIRVADGIKSDNATIKNAVNDKTLYAIPSTTQIFAYFVASSVSTTVSNIVYSANEATDAAAKALTAVKGFGVNYDPSSSTGYISSFQGGESAMLYRGYSETEYLTSIIYDYNVAPAPQYKEYENGAVKTVNGTKIKGYKATMDANSGLFIPTNTPYKAEALKYLNWLLEDEQQTTLASNKYYVTAKVYGNNALINNADYQDAWSMNYAADFNSAAVFEAAKYSSAPDWTYTDDAGAWVNEWAGPLNNQVRVGQMTLYNMFYGLNYGGTQTYIDRTNEVVATTCRVINISSHKTFQ